MSSGEPMVLVQFALATSTELPLRPGPDALCRSIRTVCGPELKGLWQCLTHEVAFAETIFDNAQNDERLTYARTGAFRSRPGCLRPIPQRQRGCPGGFAVPGQGGKAPALGVPAPATNDRRRRPWRMKRTKPKSRRSLKL